MERTYKESDKEADKYWNKHAIVKNKTPHTIFFTTGYGSPTVIKSGEWKKIDCQLAPMYKINTAGDKLTLLFKPSQYCGKTFVYGSAR